MYLYTDIGWLYTKIDDIIKTCVDLNVLYVNMADYLQKLMTSSKHE